MDMIVEEFEERIEKFRMYVIKETMRFHSRIQKKIDFVRFNGWLREHPTAKCNCVVTDTWSRHFTIYISNVTIEDFIENILGPYHLRFDIKWQMEIIGGQEDPVFKFYNVKSYSWGEENFQVKEGDFKTCKIVKKLDHIEKREDEEVYRLEMICE